MSRPRIFLSAGELSGDYHAANVLRLLRDQCDIRGVFGPHCRRELPQGREIAGIEELSVMGLVEVLRQWRSLRRVWQRLCAELRREPPDLILLVDFPGFNLRLLRFIRRELPAHTRVVYYIPPKVWAWKPGRAALISRHCDLVATIFPFENSWYAADRVQFVGNPLLDDVPAPAEPGDALCLLPGSRRSEIQRLLPLMVEIARRFPQIPCRMPLAPSLDVDQIHQQLKDIQAPANIDLRQEPLIECCQGARAAVAASGTASLELAVMGIPHLVVYQVSPMTWHIGKRLVRLAHVSLPNIVAGREILPEFLQERAHPDMIVPALQQLLDNPQQSAQMRQSLLDLREQLGDGRTGARMADLLWKMLKERSS